MSHQPMEPISKHPHVGIPNPLHSLLESRSLLELAELPAFLPLLVNAPAGDGHPVLLLPGFMADEGSLVALEYFLKYKGYDVQTWGLGRNVGLQSRHLRVLPEKLRYMHYKSGRKVSLVGWSLGGVFSVVGAADAQDCVRTVITLGSPLSPSPGGSKTSPMSRAMYRVVAHPMGGAAHTMKPRLKPLREGKWMDVPLSCIYSLTDGVVPPQEATISGDPAMRENIEVPGSHMGLGFNGLVLAIVAERLAQPEDEWSPFRASGLLAHALRLMKLRELGLGGAFATN